MKVSEEELNITTDLMMIDSYYPLVMMLEFVRAISTSMNDNLLIAQQ